MKVFSKIKKTAGNIIMLPKIKRQLDDANKELRIVHGEVEAVQCELGMTRRTLGMVCRALGRIETRQCRQNTGGGVEFQVSSQWGQDGIIQYLINNINISRQVFIEFGTESYVESNTRFLLMNDNWAGLIIDGSEDNINCVKRDEIYWMYNIKAVAEFITVDNINDIFRNNGMTGNIGLMSVDIDGNDFWVWRAIDAVSPDIVICEYNPRFGKDKAVTVPYNAEFTRFKYHYSGIYFGASIKALTLLANQKGYALAAGTMKGGSDLFFVKRNLLNDAVKEHSIEEIFVPNQYQDSRDENGNLNRISFEEEQNIIWSLPLEDVSNLF